MRLLLVAALLAAGAAVANDDPFLKGDVAYGAQGNWPLAIVYFGYAFANTGLLWLDRLMTAAPR